jgi:hypothetical protein
MKAFALLLISGLTTVVFGVAASRAVPAHGWAIDTVAFADHSTQSIRWCVSGCGRSPWGYTRGWGPGWGYTGIGPGWGDHGSRPSWRNCHSYRCGRS